MDMTAADPSSRPTGRTASAAAPVAAVVCTLALALSPAAVRGAGEPAGTLPVPAAMTVRGVPPLPASLEDELRPFENLRFARFADWHPSERRMLITTRFAQTSQLHELAMPMGARRQITFYDEPVAEARYRPGNPQQIAFTRDVGGNENYQVYLLDRATGRTRRLSDGEHRYEGLQWSPDGRLLSYTSNARNGRDTDLYVLDPDAGVERRVAEVSGTWFPSDWSRDGRRILLIRFISVNESYIEAAWVETGEVNHLTPTDSPAAYFDAKWSGDGTSVYTVTDRDSEFRRLVRLDLGSGLSTVLSGELPWDVEAFDVSDDGTLLAFFTNEDGASHLHLLDARTGEALPAPDLPAGVSNALRFRTASREVAFTLSWARSPTDVYSYDAASRRLERWTESEVGGLDVEAFPTPELVRFPTFDTLPSPNPRQPGERRTIPAFVYRPPRGRFQPPYPVYVTLHGGPEGQWRPRFLASDNYLLNDLGVALVYPNVRGSEGYGKSYLLLDNGRLREDSVRDVGALLDWIATQPDLDSSRVMVAGGSYGGYMVLASLVHYSDRLAAAFDAVGISNFVTFLENTEDYRRDLRRAEYGDERDPEMRRFLTEISPANHVEAITRPLLVAQGANDPRVPSSESDRIVEALEARRTPVWYLLANDEGHGFRKKANTDYLRAAWLEFVRRYLLGGGSVAGATGSP